METAVTDKQLISNDVSTHLSSALVKTLLYFDIFKHPLTAEELHEYCQEYVCDIADVKQALNNLLQSGYIKRENSYYFISDSSIIQRRENGSQLAEKQLKIAARFSKIISFFPFVRAVCLSGSLSKGYMDAKTDIDYFIITAPGRLWLCRTFLILFKKIFLLNSKKYFCVNYFVDTDNLIIPDKNIFTATEIVFLKPTYGTVYYNQLMEQNSWTRQYYPNTSFDSKTIVSAEKNSILKRFMENIFSRKIGERLDAFFFTTTLKFWKAKFKNFNDEEFDLHLRSRKNVSKHHPNAFQEKVMAQYNKKIKEFESQFQFQFNR